MRKKISLLTCMAGLGVATAASAENQPIQINDVVYGLNRGTASETTQHVRGDPAPVNGGAKLGTSWSASFIQSVQFDNLDGFSHAYDGNILGVNFGATPAAGGTISNLQSRFTPGSLDPGVAQTVFDFTTYNTANPGAPLTASRIVGLSVSPNNSRVAFTGNDSGRVYVMDYAAGATPGTGAGASLTNGRELSILVSGASNTQGTIWLDNDNLLTVDNNGSVKKVTIDAGGSLSSADVGSVTFPAAAAAASSLAYQPTLSPYVYLSVGQFSGTTQNRLYVLDPNNSFALVNTFDYSTSINTAREIGFDSKGNLYVSEFGNTSSTPLGGSIDVIVGANQLANLANNNSHKFYTQDQLAALSAQFSGLDVATSALDYATADVTVDVRDKSVTVPYFGASPADTIRQRLLAGRNGGDWNGTGSAIRSSTAAGNVLHNTGIAYVEAGDLPGLIGTQWGGQTVTSTSILMKYTWNGDTDLNGVVGFDDYTRIDQGFNLGRTGWFNGDFDYSGVIGFDDYSLIDLAFNTQSGTLARAISYLSGADTSSSGMDAPSLQMIEQHLNQFGSAYAQAFLAQTPEPTSIGLMGLAAAAMLSRRRRNA